MLVATWVLAVATAILALSVPVAWITWLSGRRRDREQHQREQATEARAGILKEASDKYVSKDAATGAGVLGLLVAIIAFFSWLEGRKPKA